MNSFPKTVRRFSSSSTFGKSLVGSGIAVCSLGFGYLLFNKKEMKSQLRSLPTVESLIPIEKVHEILKSNQVSLKGTASIVRMDLNSVASNSPSEDYHSEHKTNDEYILGIYDGHGGPECGDLVSKTIASYVHEYIKKATTPKEIKEAMKQAFIQLDHDIIHGALQAVPVNSSSWWNPIHKSVDFNGIMTNLKSATSGSCALVAYIKGNDLYIASIGDCRAVLGRRISDSFEAIALSEDQTGTNPNEFSRLCEEHPGEEATVIVRGRVLGGLMPTRAFGDARYKWNRQIQNVVVPFVYPTGRRGIPKNLLSPPYVNSSPEVVHYQRDQNDLFLILACDGLWDDMSSEQSVQLVSKLIKEKYSGNYATALIKAALSGYGEGGGLENWERIQHHYSIPSPQSRRYRDDMTINVVFFDGVEQKGNEIPVIPRYKKPTAPQLETWIHQIQSRLQSKL